MKTFFVHGKIAEMITSKPPIPMSESACDDELKEIVNGERVFAVNIYDHRGNVTETRYQSASGRAIRESVFKALKESGDIVPIAPGSQVYQHKDRVGECSVREHNASAIAKAEADKQGQELIRQFDEQKKSRRAAELERWKHLG